MNNIPPTGPKPQYPVSKPAEVAASTIPLYEQSPLYLKEVRLETGKFQTLITFNPKADQKSIVNALRILNNRGLLQIGTSRTVDALEQDRFLKVVENCVNLAKNSGNSKDIPLSVISDISGIDHKIEVGKESLIREETSLIQPSKNNPHYRYSANPFDDIE